MAPGWSKLLQQNRLIAGMVLALVLLAVISIFSGQDHRTHLEKIQARGSITIITRNSATAYYLGPHGYTGFEYDLANMFADHTVVAVFIKMLLPLPIIIPAIFMGLGLMVSFLQAFVFALLTMIYIGSASAEPH